MITAKSMEVRDNFKVWCTCALDGEVVQIARPGNNYVYLINQETYDNLNTNRRMNAYMSYLVGKDKIFNLKKLSEIEKLPENWNNNGAQRIPTNIIKKVRRLITKMDCQPEMFPIACEALQLEWENDRSEYLEMEVLNKNVNIFQIDIDGNEIHKEIPFDENMIITIVREFYDRGI